MINELLPWIALFVVSLVVLIKGSDYFTESAENIGIHLRISQIVIGVTIVSIGTSLPELISSVISVYEGVPEVVAGNVVGSNIANILLILACGAAFSRNKLRIQKNLLPVDLPLLIGSAFFLAICVYEDHVFSFGEAVLFVLGYIIYSAYNIVESRKDQKAAAKTRDEYNVSFPVKDAVILLISAVFVYLGAKYTVLSIIQISEIANIATGIIAVTAVALGTSLPELAVTLAAAKKNNAGIAVGNILGSNIFNTFGVMGIPGLIAPLPFPDSLINPGLMIMLAATILFLVVAVDKEISRWEGMFFLLIYIYFIGKSFNLL